MANDNGRHTFDEERGRAETNVEWRRPINYGFGHPLNSGLQEIAPMSGSGNYIKDGRGWILFGPHDVRGNHLESGYLFCLQKLPKQKEPRVRVGCRYYTLREAWDHWGFKARTGKKSARDAYSLTSNYNEGRQAVAIIRLMLLQAQAHGLLPRYSPLPKFDSSLTRKKR